MQLEGQRAQTFHKIKGRVRSAMHGLLVRRQDKWKRKMMLGKFLRKKGRVLLGVFPEPAQPAQDGLDARTIKTKGTGLFIQFLLNLRFC